MIAPSSKSTSYHSNSKTAEFARLFSLVERLASRTTRTHVMEDTQPESIPDDLAPVVNSLSGLVRTRNRGTKIHDTNLNAVMGEEEEDAEEEEDEDEDEEVAKFPLEEKRYPFTFRMMLHKLYQLDDWAQKVTEVLEKSRMEYRSLAEMGLGMRRKGEEKEKVRDSGKVGGGQREGRVEVKPRTTTTTTTFVRKPGPVRPRSLSITMAGGGKAGALKSPRVLPAKAAAEEARAVKKRCVGRRKSMSGPPVIQPGLIGGNWVYDAAVAAIEPPPRRHRVSVGALESVDPVKCSDWWVALGTGAKPGMKGTRPVSVGVFRMIDPVEGAERSARRRALSVTDNLDSTQTQGKQLKRGLE